MAPLPEERRADRNLKTVQSEMVEWAGLSPLQLVAKLGDDRMCKHILRERLTLNWKWGPLSSLSLSLHEIESAYEQDAGLMELVAHFDARAHSPSSSFPYLAPIIYTQQKPPASAPRMA